MKINATLSISNPSTGCVSICIEDVASGIRFFDATISHEEFSRALGHLQGRPFIEAEVVALQYIGKKRVTERRSIECPLKTYDRDVLVAWLAENAQEEGWLLSTYLGAQSSIAYQGDKTILNYSVTKYVEEAA